jgi:hypothetical protein
MCLPFVRGRPAGERGLSPVATERESVYSDMTNWRWFGRAPDSSDGRSRTRSLNNGIAEDVEGFGYGYVLLQPHGLDHASPLGIVGIGCDIVSGGVQG